MSSDGGAVGGVPRSGSADRVASAAAPATSYIGKGVLRVVAAHSKMPIYTRATNVEGEK